MLCTLDEKISSCPNASADKKHCVKENKQCAFSQDEEKEVVSKNEYIREPRWYEHYLK